MTRSMRNLAVFVVVVCGASLVLNGLVYPRLGLTDDLWGSDLIYRKSKFLEKNPRRFNALFLGSSMVYRQVNPAVFDSVVEALSGPELHSFNFGVNWLGSSELLYVLDRLTRADSIPYRYIFIELQKIKTVDYANYFTTRVKYWYSWDNYRFTVRAGWHSNFPVYAKVAILVSHTVNFLGNLLNLGYLTEAFRFDAQSRLPVDENEYTGQAGNGFMPLEEQEEYNVRRYPESVNERHNRFLRDTTVVTRRKQVISRVAGYFEAHPEKRNQANAPFADELNRLARLYQERGTRLIFFLPPRLDRYQYLEMIPVFNSLPADRRIDLSDAGRYPYFYQAGYSYDVTHMNAAGAARYSRELARAFVQLQVGEEAGKRAIPR